MLRCGDVGRHMARDLLRAVCVIVSGGVGRDFFRGSTPGWRWPLSRAPRPSRPRRRLQILRVKLLSMPKRRSQGALRG